MKAPNQRLYFFINGLLQVIDGVTSMIMAIFNKLGTQFNYKHFVNNVYDRINGVETK